MNKIVSLIIVSEIVCMFLAPGTIIAQDLKVSATDVTDTRSTRGNTNVEITITFFGDPLARAKSINIDTVTRATDNTGKDITRPDFFQSIFNETQILPAGADRAELRLLLTNPSRSAATISIIEGTVAVFNPTLDPQSLKTVKGFTEKPNTSLFDGKSPAGIDVMYLNKERYEALRLEEKEKINQKIAVLTEGDVEGLRTLVNNVYDFYGYSNDGKTASFYVKDDHHRVMGFEFRDEKGVEMRPSRTKMNNFYSFSFEKTITKDWTIIISMATPKSLQKIPFKLSNIPLP